MKKAFKFPLGIKFSLVILLMSLLIGALIVLVGNQLYAQQISDRYKQQGETLVLTASELLDWAQIEQYYTTLTPDDAYWATLEQLRLCAEAGDAEYLFVLRPVPDGGIYIFDTDESEEHLPLGHYQNWEDTFGEEATALAQGQRLESLVASTEYLDLVSVYVPFTDAAGNLIGYIGVDYKAQHLTDEGWSFAEQLILVTLVVALIMTAVFFGILRFMVLKPLSKISVAANSFLDDDNELSSSSRISELDIKTHDELQSLSESLKTMESKIQDHVSHLEKVTYRAETDSMTDLLNRDTFEREVSRALEEQCPEGFSVFMMIDLDNFKTVNDTYGHDIGDKVIIGCANAIQSKFRQTDFVARVGGDEFAVFYRCPPSTEEVAERAKAISDEVRKLRFGSGFGVTISIGVVIFDNTVSYTYQNLYIDADAALYTVKERGRNGFLITQA